VGSAYDAAMSYHLSLSLSRELWEELLRAALPIRLAGTSFDLARDVRAGLKQLGVRQAVAGLLDDRQPPPVLKRARDRAVARWHDYRPVVYRRVNQLVSIKGTWHVELDDMGTQLTYRAQEVHADAFVKGVAEGVIHLLRENVEIPFRIERRLGASVSLADIRYDPGHKAVIGSLQDLGVYIGDNTVLQLLARLAEYGLEQQLPRVNPVPILRREQVDEMVGGLGGPLKMKMGVEDLALVITEGELTLNVRFGFTRAQLTDREQDLP
jgi:hypothetical protein